MISSGFVRASEDSEKISIVSDFFENHKQERQYEVKTSYICVGMCFTNCSYLHWRQGFVQVYAFLHFFTYKIDTITYEYKLSDIGVKVSF